MSRYIGVSILVVALDQFTKWLVVKYLVLYESIMVIRDFFYITSHRNEGAAFGILQQQQWLFIITTMLVVGFIFYQLWRLQGKSSAFCYVYSLILGGALGNFIDRVRINKVVDFLHLRFGTYDYPIFNIADSAIVVGVFCLMILTFRDTSEQEIDK